MRCHLARLYLLLNDAARTIELLCAVPAGTLPPNGIADLATAYLACGNVAAAQRVFIDGGARFPAHADILLAQGALAAAISNWPLASDCFRQSLAGRAQCVPALIGAGQALTMLDAATEALPLLEQAAASQHPQARYWLGRALLRAERFTQAAEVLHDLWETNGECETAYYAAAAMAHAGCFNEALEQLHAIASPGALAAECEIFRCNLLLAAGQEAAAAECLAGIEAHWPSHPQLPYVRACLAYRQRAYEQAEQKIELLLSHEPDDPRYTEALVVLALKTGQYAAAEEMAHPWFARDPRSLKRAVLLAMSQLAQDKHAQVVAVLAPFLPRLRASTATRQADATPAGAALPWDIENAALWLLGKAYCQETDYQAAITCWGCLSERVPDMQRLALSINRLYYLAGDAFVRNAQLVEALDAWTHFAEGREDDEQLMSDLGELYFRVGRAQVLDSHAPGLPEGAEPFTEANRLLGAKAKVTFYRALADLRQGDHRAAEQHLARVIAADDRTFSPLAMFWLGLTSLYAEDYELAVRTLDAVRLRPYDETLRQAARHALAIAYSRQGKWQEAVALFQAATVPGGSHHD